MCLGHTHALSGAVTGLAAGSLLLHLPPEGVAALTAGTAAFAVLPDLDKTGSCAARSLGLLSEAFAWLVGKVSGGHRHGTHSLAGVAIFTGLAWLATVRAVDAHDWVARLPLMVVLALALAAGVRALRVGGHLADGLAIAAAVAIAVEDVELPLVWVACALGCATHLAGDMLTVEGIPLAWPLVPMRHHIGLPRPVGFVTGTWREVWVLAPGLIVLLGWLAWHASGVHLPPPVTR